MIAILSPAKSLNFERKNIGSSSLPRFQEETLTLVNKLKKQKSKDLQTLMKVSQKIADLNVLRFNAYTPDFNEENSRQSILVFDGGVYQGLDAPNYTKAQLNYANKSIRILSGMYGLLRPNDLIQAYRLEMGTKIKIGRKSNLYEFWGTQITDLLNQDLKDTKSKFLVNLASQEYYKAVKEDLIEAEIIHCNFKEYKGDKLRFVSFNAKKARGLMAQFIVKNKIKTPEKLKGFNYEDYYFSEEHSSKNEFIFVR